MGVRVFKEMDNFIRSRQSALLQHHYITSSGKGVETTHIQQETTWIIIVALDADVIVKAGGKNTPLLAGYVWQRYCVQHPQSIALEFVQAGVCEIFEFMCKYNPLAQSTLGG